MLRNKGPAIQRLRKQNRATYSGHHIKGRTTNQSKKRCKPHAFTLSFTGLFQKVWNHPGYDGVRLRARQTEVAQTASIF